MKMMTKAFLGFVLLGLVVSIAADGPGSCSGRCGEAFARGTQCKCDFNCLKHNECCQDFEAVCTTGQSCRGRCGEAFQRGRLCECDPSCALYNTCCHDYQSHCDASVPVSQPNTAQPLRDGTTGVNNLPPGSVPVPYLSSTNGAPQSSAFGSSLGGRAPVSPSGSGSAGRVNFHLVLSPRGQNSVVSAPAAASVSRPRPRPSTLQDVAQALGLSVFEGGFPAPTAGVLADVDLCSNSAIDGLTALSNGTILIFQGQFFWSVDPASRLMGHPQSITDTLGVASPIDTVFTRQNCHGKIYIIKGAQLWRLDENLVLEPGFPKPLTAEFPGLTGGGISAALAVPATSSRPETIFFFKDGDIMQRFTFPPGSVPSCTRRPESFSMRRAARQAEVLLSGEINIKVALSGFPSPITSALTVAPHGGSNRYEYYIFSGPLFFTVQIPADLPVLAEPDTSAVFAPQLIVSPVTEATNPANMAVQNPPLVPPHPANSILVWLRCP